MRQLVAVLLAIVGTLAVGVGILYLIQPAGFLPTFFPGYVAHAAGKHPSRGYAGIIFGAALLIGSFVLVYTTPRRGTFH